MKKKAVKSSKAVEKIKSKPASKKSGEAKSKLESPPVKLKSKAKPKIPLSRHHLIPAIMMRMEAWRPLAVDKTFLDRIARLLGSPGHVANEVRGVLERVRFGGEAEIEDPGKFDSRKFYYLANMLMMDILSVEVMEAPRRAMGIDKAGMWLEEDWAGRRSHLMV